MKLHPNGGATLAPKNSEVKQKNTTPVRPPSLPVTSPPRTVTLNLEPDAYALLVAMMHQQDRASVEELICAELGMAVAGWAGAMSRDGDIEALFVEAAKQKEAA